MANGKRIGWAAVAGSGVALIVGMVVAQVFPAAAAPPAPPPTSVVVTNTPLPVSGNVQVTGGVQVTNTTPLPVTGDVQVTGDVVVSGTTEAVPVPPSAPFTDSVSLLNNDAGTVGIPQSRMGLTSMTVTNFDTIPHQVRVFRPVVSGTACNAADIVGGAAPSFNVLVAARSTLHLPFPTAMVFGRIGAVTCLATQVMTAQTNAVEVIFNGLGD